MTTDSKTYLATQIISEKQTLSYRNVARALKVHVNAAKCMLYEFHEEQNKRKPGSIYATYLLAGTRKPVDSVELNGKVNGVHHDDDDDIPMPSSPPPFTSSMLQPSQEIDEGKGTVSKTSVKTITLVREENLEEIKREYEDITSLHIYSLSPSKLADLVTLIDIGRGLYTDVFAKEDPLTNNNTYGVIQNPQVRRRKGKRPIIPDAPPPKFQPVKNEPKPAATKPSASTTTSKPPALNREDSSRPSSRDSTSTKDSTKPTLKRDASDLFKAFAKSKKPSLKSTLSEDTTMSNPDDDDEGQSEDEALFLDTNTRKPSTRKRPSDANKDRADKAAKLRKMMDSDDDEPAVPNVEKASGVKEAPVTAMEGGASAETKASTKQEEEDADVAWSDSDTEKQRQTAPGTDQSTNQNGGEMAEATGPKRRRGKRKVMKKRTMKDEDGYLVTKEEEAWESFSEDEPQPPKAKTNVAGGGGGAAGLSKGGMKPLTANEIIASGKKKKAGGGGNIMSFFGKK